MSSCSHANLALPRISLARRVLPAFAIFLLTFALFSPSIGYELIGLDDYDYLLGNPLFTDGFTIATLKSVAISSQLGMYIPLLSVSHGLDALFLGATTDNPWGLHFSNVLFHAFNASLLYVFVLLVCRRPWVSFLLAALWAWHPLRVGSVAWVSSRKDVLAGFFFLLCIIGYLCAHKTRRKNTNWRKPLFYYALSNAAFLCGVLTKAALVPTPLILLLLDIGPLRRLDWSWPSIIRTGPRLLLEKAPYFLLSFLAALGAVHFHQQIHALAEVPFSTGMLSIPIHYLFYIRTMLFPHLLSPLYPEIHPSLAYVLFSCITLLILTIGTWIIRERHPYVLLGWLFFIGMSLPTIGFIRFGLQSVADRYSYLPTMGVSFALCSCLSLIRTAAPRIRRILKGCAWGVLIVLAIMSFQLQSVWRSTATVIAHMLTVIPDNPRALGLQASYYIEMYGDYNSAQQNYDRIFQGRTYTHDDTIGRARCLLELSGPAEALYFLNTVPLTHNPERDALLAWDAARYALVATDHEAALTFGTEALRLFPHNDQNQKEYLHLLLMTAAFEKGDSSLALYHGRQFPAYFDKDAIELRDLLPYYLHQWMLFYRTDAYTFFKRLLDAHPEDVGLQNNIAWGLATANWSPASPESVVALAQRAQQALPDHPGVWDTLAAAQANAGDFIVAVHSIQRALELTPDIDDARAIAFRDRLQHRLDLYRKGEPYREDAFARLMAAQFGEGLPMERMAAP